jgi:hypothetical protein
MINPELFERVERSLRKRLHADIRLLLLRCAARARDESDFLVAASRLLADAGERKRWLASWPAANPLQRIDTGNGGLTEPGPLDGSHDHAAESPENWNIPESVEPEEPAVSQAEVEGMRAALAQELGPIASLLVTKESAASKSVADLRDRLLSHLETEAERLRFRRHTQKWVVDSEE